MRLEELLFCLIFLVLPLVGMMGSVIGRVLKGEALKNEEVLEDQGISLLRLKQKRALINFAFFNEGVMDVQNIDGQVHIPCTIKKLKERTQPRAGP